MKLRTFLASLAVLVISTSVAFADSKFNQVKPGEYDPGKSQLVQGAWLAGLGCPTMAEFSNAYTGANDSYTDPACAAGGDEKDKHNEGLILAKTGPTANNAAAYAVLENVKGMTLTELGYDIRKPSASADPRGSHCGAGSPRFNVTTTAGFFFIGCNSPPATQTTVGSGWLRLRWGVGGPLQGYLGGVTLTTITGEVKSIAILFDEGQDALGAPDMFGLAVLDNIDVNGMLVGRGPTDAD